MNDYPISIDRAIEIATWAMHGLMEDDVEQAMEYFDDTIGLTEEEYQFFGVRHQEEERSYTTESSREQSIFTDEQTSEEEEIMENNKFEAGKKIGIAFSKKQIVSERNIEKKRFNKETEKFEPILNEDGTVKVVKEHRVKLPSSSQYSDFIFTTTENAFEPHKFDKDKNDLGKNENMLMVKVFENSTYKLTRTPYVLDENGEPKINEQGKKTLDFTSQDVVKITGTELQKEFDSWKSKNREQNSALGEIKTKGTKSEKDISQQPKPEQER